MSLRRTVVITVAVWIVVITALHLWLNLHVRFLAPNQDALAEDKFRIGFLPVT